MASKIKLSLVSLGILMFAAFMVMFVMMALVVRDACSRYHDTERRKQNVAMHKRYLRSVHHAQPISFETDDGLKLSGLLIIRPKARRNFLVCHGYHMTKELVHHYVDLFPQDNFLLFDFRTHGESEGEWITFGAHETSDVRAAVNVLQTHEQTRGLPVVGIGVSMGGSILLKAACGTDDFQAVVVESTFCSLEQQIAQTLAARKGISYSGVGFACKLAFGALMGLSLNDLSPERFIHLCEVPTLFIHSTADDLIPHQSSCVLHERAPGRKDLWLVEGSRHLHICRDHCPEYSQRVSEFLFDVSKK